MPIEMSGLHADYVFDDEASQKAFMSMNIPPYFALRGRGGDNFSRMDGIIEDIRKFEDVGLPLKLKIHISDKHAHPTYNRRDKTIRMSKKHMQLYKTAHELQHAFDDQNDKELFTKTSEYQERRANKTERRYR